MLSSVQRFCSTLLQSLANLASISCQCLSSTKDPLPNFSDEEVLFLALKALANYLASFFFLSISSGRATTMTYIPFSVQPIIGHGVQVALACSDCFSGQSLGLVSSNTDG